MRIIEVAPSFWYSCQVCQKNFEGKDEYKIRKGYSPLCSNKCLFMLYYKIISDCPKETLVILAEALEIKDFSKVTDQNLIFEVTKKYPKPSLSLLNEKVTEKVTERLQKVVTRKVTGYNNSPLYDNRGVVTEPVTKFFDETKMECNQKCH